MTVYQLQGISRHFLILEIINLTNWKNIFFLEYNPSFVQKNPIIRKTFVYFKQNGNEC